MEAAAPAPLKFGLLAPGPQLMRQPAQRFGLPLRELALDGLDPERDLLEPLPH